MCSDSEKKMSACADQNHAPSLTYVRLETHSVFKLTLVVFFHNKSEPCNNDMAPKLHYFSFFFKEDRVKIVINSAAANAIQPAKTFGPIFANVS